MNDKICPFCKKKAKIKTILDPYKGTGVAKRLKLYDYVCGTKGCYMEDGGGHYCTMPELESMWARVRDGSGSKYTVHYSPDDSKETIPCSSRSTAHSWTGDKRKVSCGRCVAMVEKVKPSSLAQTV